jgi:hypothetical protein
MPPFLLLPVLSRTPQNACHSDPERSRRGRTRIGFCFCCCRCRSLPHPQQNFVILSAAKNPRIGFAVACSCLCRCLFSSTHPPTARVPHPSQQHRDGWECITQACLILPLSLPVLSSYLTPDHKSPISKPQSHTPKLFFTLLLSKIACQAPKPTQNPATHSKQTR